MREIKLAIFDMDGVIFEGSNFWLDLHNYLGTAEDGVRLAKDHIATDYDLLAKLVLKDLWTGKSAKGYWSLVEKRKYHKGIKPLFQYLQKENIKTAIVSSGPWHLAKRAKDELGIDIIYANRLRFYKRQFSKSIEIMVPDARKAEVGREIMQTLKTDSTNTIFIGDSDADVPLAEMVETSVAYNSSSKKLNEVSTIVLKQGELPNLIEIIKGLKSSSG